MTLKTEIMAAQNSNVQINAALLNIRDVFQKHKNLTNPYLLNSNVCLEFLDKTLKLYLSSCS